MILHVNICLNVNGVVYQPRSNDIRRLAKYWFLTWNLLMLVASVLLMVIGSLLPVVMFGWGVVSFVQDWIRGDLYWWDAWLPILWYGLPLVCGIWLAIWLLLNRGETEEERLEK